MINFKNGTMRLQTPKPEPIKQWTVYFQTPEGLFTELHEAVASAEKLGYPIEAIQPVPIALDEHGHYEVVVR